MKRLGQLDIKGRIKYNESGLLQFTALHLLLSGLVIKEKTTIACKAPLTAYIHRELSRKYFVTNMYTKPVTSLDTPITVIASHRIKFKAALYCQSVVKARRVINYFSQKQVYHIDYYVILEIL